jgi:hypothetical protein
MCAETDAAAADTVCNTKSADDELDLVAELSKLLSESAESVKSGDQGKVVAASFRMNTLENNEQASLRVVVIERVTLLTPSQDAEEYAAFYSWKKWGAVFFVSLVLALLLFLLAIVLGPISLVLCIIAGIYTPSATTTALVTGSDRAVGLAKIGSAVLSFSYFIMQPHATQLQHQALSESFDGRIDWLEILRGMVLVLVLLLRKEQSLKQSFASLLALALLLGMQYAASDVFMQSLYRVSEEFVLAGVSSESHLIFHFVMRIFAASIAAVISWQSCPPLYDVFHQRLLNCIYLRPSMWRITGGPAEFPRNGCFRSLPAITRALQLHEKHRPDTQLAIGPFSSEMLLKHCAYIGLAGWYNSTKLRARCFICLKLLRYVIQAVLFVSSMVVFVTSGIPDLWSKCDNDTICRDFIEYMRLWLDHDCIINAAYFFAPHLFLFRVPFLKVITEIFASLALSFIWLRPVVEPLLNFVVRCLHLLKKVRSWFQGLCEKLVLLFKFLLKPVQFAFTELKTLLAKFYSLVSRLWFIVDRLLSIVRTIFSSFQKCLSQLNSLLGPNLHFFLQNICIAPFSFLRRWLGKMSAIANLSFPAFFKNMFDAFKGTNKNDSPFKKIAEGAAIQAGAKVVKAIDFMEGVDQFKVKNHQAARGIWERLKSVTVPRWCMTLLKYALGVVAAYLALSLLYHKMQNAPPQHGLQ